MIMLVFYYSLNTSMETCYRKGLKWKRSRDLKGKQLNKAVVNKVANEVAILLKILIRCKWNGKWK